MTRPVEIISTVVRKRRWALEEKARILEEAFRPGASVSAVAARYDVTRALIYLWRRRAQEGRLPGIAMAPAPPPIFVPIQVGTAALVTDPDPTGPGANGERRTSRGRVEIVLSNGRVLKVEESIAPMTLARIVAVLDAVTLP